MVSSAQNETAVELLLFFPIIMSGATLLMYLYFKSFNIENLPNMWGIPIYVSLGLSVMNLLIPNQSINKGIFKIAH